MDGPLGDTVPAEAAVTVRGLLTFTFGLGMAPEMFLAPEPWPVVAAAAQAGLATIGSGPYFVTVTSPPQGRIPDNL